MAIGLSNVETRKVKREKNKESESKKLNAKSRMASTLIENSAKAMGALSVISATEEAPLVSNVATSVKTKKERTGSTGELNSLWMDWSTQVAGVEAESLALVIARQWMEIERFVFELVTDSVLRELRKTAFGARVVSQLKKRVGSTRFSNETV